MTAIWVLPIVTLVVASTTGGILAAAIQEFNPMFSVVTLTVAAFMTSLSLGLAFMILTMYLLRLITYGLPSGTSITTVFIPLGPMGQSGASLLLIGTGFKSALPMIYDDSDTLGLASTGETIHIVCIILAFVLWALATMWMLYGVLAVQEVALRDRIPFKLTFWGLIFPNVCPPLSFTIVDHNDAILTLISQGVYANLTIGLAAALNSKFFRVWGSIYSAITLILWIWVFVRTLFALKGGAIFEDPAEEDIEPRDNVQKHTINASEESVTRTV